MAYSTVLKDVGVLMQTMYLVATAMGLSPCAIGCGDAEKSARLLGTRFEAESSVGEFLLGGPPAARSRSRGPR
jgi:SagB-type dehydrogenase family enzyme